MVFSAVLREWSCIDLGFTAPADGDGSSHHDFDHLGEDKPVKPEAECLGYGMSQYEEPCQASGEQYKFCAQGGDCGAGKDSSAVLHDPASQCGDDRIGQEKTAGRTQQLRNSTRARGTEDG